MPSRSSKEKTAIVEEAHKRFKRAQAWESLARARWLDDVKFAEGDSDNLYQWPEDIRQGRQDDERPMLTINKTRQHVLDILNDARQSKVSIKVRPVGDGADVKSSQVYMGVIRHIEYVSSAQAAYQHGLRFAVQGGKGWWRVVTDYSSDDSFDQEIFIRRVNDPLSVYLDPDIKEFDGSDARWGFVFSDMARDAFDEEYPKWKDQAANEAFGDSSWVGEDSVRVAEYYRRVKETETLWAFPDLEADPSGSVMKVELESKIDPAMIPELKRMPGVRRRAVPRYRVEWFLIVGDKIADERDWPGIYIPLVRCVGEETVIQGQYDCKGHVRALKDPQRMFNYNASAAVEYGALQSKSPYIGAVEAFEGLEAFWDNANRENWPYLPFNSVDDDGNPIDAPQRQPPPMGAPVFMQGMVDAAEQMRMVSGQYQADMGAPSNERSGVAIMQRQRQGDNATYHYLDHQASSIRFTGKILIDLIPKIYDTRRVIQFMGDDGVENQITIDPAQEQALMETKKKDISEVERIFNPNIGRYDVESDVGPAFATRRQEAFAAYTEILANNKELTAVIGDLALKFADFPGAEEAAARLKRMVPRQALEDGPPPEVAQAQAQVKAMEDIIKKLADKLADKTMETRNDQEKNTIEAYKAQNGRLSALKELLPSADPAHLLKLINDVLAEVDATSAEGAALAPALTMDTQVAQPQEEADPMALAGQQGEVEAAPPGAGAPGISEGVAPIPGA